MRCRRRADENGGADRGKCADPARCLPSHISKPAKRPFRRGHRNQLWLGVVAAGVNLSGKRPNKSSDFATVGHTPAVGFLRIYLSDRGVGGMRRAGIAVIIAAWLAAAIGVG